MDELQACTELAFAVFPESTALFQPGETAFDDPAFGQYGESMQLTALDDLNGGLQALHYAVGKGLAAVATLRQHAFHALQIRLAVSDTASLASSSTTVVPEKHTHRDARIPQPQLTHRS